METNVAKLKTSNCLFLFVNLKVREILMNDFLIFFDQFELILKAYLPNRFVGLRKVFVFFDNFVKNFKIYKKIQKFLKLFLTINFNRNSVHQQFLKIFTNCVLLT